MTTNQPKSRASRMPLFYGFLASMVVFGLIAAMKPESVAVAVGNKYGTPEPTPTPIVKATPAPTPEPPGVGKTKKGRTGF